MSSTGRHQPFLVGTTWIVKSESCNRIVVTDAQLVVNFSEERYTFFCLCFKLHLPASANIVDMTLAMKAQW
jgi:hypothetical protein